MFVCVDPSSPAMIQAGPFTSVHAFVTFFSRTYGYPPKLFADPARPGFYRRDHARGELLLRPLAPTPAEQAKADAYNAKCIEEDALAETIAALREIVGRCPTPVSRHKTVELDDEDVEALKYAIKRLEVL